ncbi:MAG: SDR family NAD(P)-dependent oxidoreductase [Bacteroidales bacterium]
MPNGSRGLAAVTGASSGIGLELAKLLAADGFDLVLVARDSPRLQHATREVEALARGGRVASLGIDLAQPGAARTLFERLDAAASAPAVFINNAGFGLRGPFSKTPLGDELEMIQVNVTALTELTKLSIARMVPRGDGRILNVASTAAFQPGPFMAVYYATKAYVLSLSEALHNELQGTNVSVTTLCPGPTATRFEARSGMSGSRLFRRYVMSAQRVARMGYEGMMRRDRLVVAGLRNRVLIESQRLAPRGAVQRITRWLQE